MDETTPKKLFPGNFENGTTILPPRVTSSRSRGYVAPSRRKPPPDGDDEERITNQKKQRYWNSYEEMYIVELWRRHKDEVTEFNKPLPVHRKIMVAMRSKDMMVTGQDCRRKMNTLNNRYKAEVQRTKLNGIKSDWRLFPLIHCFMEPKIKQYDPWHETKVVKKLLEKIPKPPELKCPPPPSPVVTPPVVHATPRQPLQQHRSHVNPSNTRGSLIASIPLQSIAPNTNIQFSGMPSPLGDNVYYPSFAMHQTTTMSTPFSSSKMTAKSNLPFRDITLQKYEQLKLNNEILRQQRDTALKRLRLEEESLKAFETFLSDWAEQAEVVLKKIERLSRLPSNVISKVGNEENNGHVEQAFSVN